MAENVDIHDLVKAVSIETISFLEVSAKRADTFSKMSPSDEFEVEPEMGLQIGRNENRRNFRIRVQIKIDAEPGSVLVDGAVEYAVDGIDTSAISGEVLLEFANKVGIFTLIPYLRQGISDITQRVFGSPLVMPVYRQGDFEFGPEDPPTGVSG